MVEAKSVASLKPTKGLVLRTSNRTGTTKANGAQNRSSGNHGRGHHKTTNSNASSLCSVVRCPLPSLGFTLGKYNIMTSASHRVSEHRTFSAAPVVAALTLSEERYRYMLLAHVLLNLLSMLQQLPKGKAVPSPQMVTWHSSHGEAAPAPRLAISSPRA